MVENFIIIDFTYANMSKNKQQDTNAKVKNISSIWLQFQSPVGHLVLVDSLASSRQTQSLFSFVLCPLFQLPIKTKPKQKACSAPVLLFGVQSKPEKMAENFLSHVCYQGKHTRELFSKVASRLVQPITLPLILSFCIFCVRQKSCFSACWDICPPGSATGKQLPLVLAPHSLSLDPGWQITHFIHGSWRKKYVHIVENNLILPTNINFCGQIHKVFINTILTNFRDISHF